MSRTIEANAPRVWIGCLECYNNGRLVGDWYPATEAGTVTTSQLHGRAIPPEAHEELWCLDVEGLPESREMDPMEAQRWGEIYEEVGPGSWPALCAWVRSGAYAAEGNTDYPVVSDFEERYCGEWPSFLDYATDYIDDTGMLRDVPDEIARFFDTRAFADELEVDYSVERSAGGGVYIFRNF